MNQVTSINRWNRVLGPFYVASSLERRGIEVTGDLIDLSTGDGTTVYPNGQFDILDESRLQRREPVIELWNRLIRPEIEIGVVDGWTATGVLLQRTPGEPSPADKIAGGALLPESVERDIKEAIFGWKQ